MIRSSSVGYLFIEPKSKEAKERGDLSETAKTYLIKEYIRLKYGREEDIVTKQMQKGIDAEEDSIDLLSIHQQKTLKKNTERVNNDYITGLPDVFEGESITSCDFLWDIKTSWSIWTFLANLKAPLSDLYYYQLQSYMWLTGCQNSAISYVLADAPIHIVEAEKRKLLYSMNVISEESPEYLQAVANLENNMIYADLPLEERILIFPVERDEEVIQKIKTKVEKAREFLAQFEKDHLNFNKNKRILHC